MQLDDIGELEKEWLEREKRLRDQPNCYGWEPYPPAMFANLVYLAMARTGLDASFLDVGGGIGTKALIAQRIGLRATSVELFKPYVKQSIELGVNTIEADIRTWSGYRDYDILYINHPLRDIHREDWLEERIHRMMKPGAIIITVQNMRTLPPDWEVIARPLWPINMDRHLRFDWIAVKPDVDCD